MTSGVVAVLVIMLTVSYTHADVRLRPIDDRRHQWLTEISIIDNIREKLIAGNSSYVQSPGFGFYFSRNASTVNNNSAVTTQHAINTIVDRLRPLSSDAKIKTGIDDAIQALKTRDANKALLDLNQVRGGINQQLANLAISTSNSTLRNSNTNSTL